MMTSERDLLVERTQDEARADLAEMYADLRELADLEAGYDDWFATPALSPEHQERRVEGYERQRRVVEDLCARIGARSPYKCSATRIPKET